jgi:sigma-E factor negative regulatory protein RseA
MTKDSREICSSLMDGEWQDGAFRDDLASVAQDMDAKSAWERFHLLGSLLRDEVSVLAAPGFADRVAEAIDKEPHVVASASWAREEKDREPWLKKAVGLGVAASVALLVTFSFQGAPTTDNSSDVSINPYNLPVSSVVPASAQIQMTRSLPSMEEQQRMQALLVEHWQGAARETVQYTLPYARLISLNPVEEEQGTQDVQASADRR